LGRFGEYDGGSADDQVRRTLHLEQIAEMKTVGKLNPPVEALFEKRSERGIITYGETGLVTAELAAQRVQNGNPQRLVWKALEMRVDTAIE
jgi:hypothetical protein